MSMRKRIAKGVGYTMAPKATFAALHPKKAVYAKAAMWLFDRVTPNRRRKTHKRSMATGIGAAAMTIPLGVWLGRRLMSDRATTSHTATR